MLLVLVYNRPLSIFSLSLYIFRLSIWNSFSCVFSRFTEYVTIKSWTLLQKINCIHIAQMVRQGIFKTRPGRKLQFLSGTTRFLNRYFPVFLVHPIETRVKRSEIYEMEYFSPLSFFFIHENEYLWIFPFPQGKDR